MCTNVYGNHSGEHDICCDLIQCPLDVWPRRLPRRFCVSSLWSEAESAFTDSESLPFKQTKSMISATLHTLLFKKKKMDCWDLVWKGGFSVCSKIWAKSLWSDIREDLTHSLVEPSLRLSIQRQRSTMIWRGCRIQLWLEGRKQQYRGHQHISSDLLFIMCLNASCADTDRALNPLLLTAKFPVWTQC